MNLNDLSQDDKDVIQDILMKERKDLLPEDIKILKARKDYIRADEYERLIEEEEKKLEKVITINTGKKKVKGRK